MASFEGVLVPLTTPFRGDDIAPDRFGTPRATVHERLAVRAERPVMAQE